MKYKKGDLVMFQKRVSHSHQHLSQPIMIILSVVDEIYTRPYGEGYRYRFLDTGREEVSSIRNFESITEKIG
jgi:hypothetical protein